MRRDVPQRDATRCTMALSAEAKLVAAYLEKHCRGRAAARAQHLIRDHLAAAGCRISGREFFDLEAELVAAGVPLGTSGAGVFLCVEPEDYDAAYRYIVSRFEPMRERAEALRRMKDRLPAAEAQEVAQTGQGMLFNRW